jgi:hypothetical protein
VRWGDERYVRIYCRDNGDWLALGWEAQALLCLAMRKTDRAGILDVGKNAARGLSAITGMPVEVVERALPILLEDGCLIANETKLVWRNFLEAQEAPATDAQRAREARARARDKAASRSVTVKQESLPPPSQNVTESSQPATDGHESSQPVTPFRSGSPSSLLSVPDHGREASRVKLRPDIGHNLVWCIKVAVERAQPKGGPWAPDTFAEENASRLLMGLGDLEKAMPDLERKIVLFSADPEMQPWTVKKFCDNYNGIGLPKIRKPGEMGKVNYRG